MAESFEFLNHVPYIALVLCVALTSGIYIGLAEWTRGIAHGHYNHKTPFQTITPWLKIAFTTVVLASLMRQAFFLNNALSSYITESMLLVLLIIAFLIKRKLIRRDTNAQLTRNTLQTMQKIALYCAFTITLWIILMGFFFTNLIIVQLLNSALPLTINALQLSVMATGLLSLMPFYFWYTKAKEGEKKGHLKTPEHYKFHHILWPYIVGLFIFILPLFMEKIAASEKYHAMMNTKQYLELI